MMTAISIIIKNPKDAYNSMKIKILLESLKRKNVLSMLGKHCGLIITRFQQENISFKEF